MRIAQVSPLYESVPPRLYGGTERVVSYLTEELVARGHDVTLFASGDSRTGARLVAPVQKALRLAAECKEQLAPHFCELEEVFDRVDDFDVVHWHIDYLHYPLSSRREYPHLTTLHGRLDMAELQPLYDRYHDEPVVSISNNQRTPLPQANWVGTVYHGLPLDVQELCNEPQDYLVCVGRISPEKRMDRAIEIAIRADMPLKIAAKVDHADEDYFVAKIKPLLDHPLVEFVGELGEKDKGELVGKARAFLFPIDWPEPFGLVMIESFSVGTPVIGWRCGSVPEVIDDGVTGYVIDSIGNAVAAIPRCIALDRAQVRATFEQRFSAKRMAQDYLSIYARPGTSINGDERGEPAEQPTAAHYAGAGAGDHPS